MTTSKHQTLMALREHLSSRLIDLDDLIERCLIGLLTGKHILIEGMPGLAKTRSVKELAIAINAVFERVQCTPDLLPADITGSLVFRQNDGAFDFVKGPLFSNLLLVDEINRSPPKVQSALLEAMEERQVTVARDTYALPDPFLVIATQNPIELEGTFPLPEAQLDRFLLKYSVPMPSADTEMRILDMAEQEDIAQPEPKVILGINDIQEARKEISRVHVSAALKDYIIRIVAATRDEVFAGVIENPISPRGSIALASASRARAFLAGRDHALPEDVDALAMDALTHRLGLTWQAVADGRTQESVLSEILDATDAL